MAGAFQSSAFQTSAFQTDDEGGSITGKKKHDADLAERVREWHAIEDRQRDERLEKARARAEAVKKEAPPPRTKKAPLKTVVVMAPALPAPTMNPVVLKRRPRVVAPGPVVAPVLPEKKKHVVEPVEEVAADELDMLLMMLDDADIGPLEISVVPARPKEKRTRDAIDEDEAELLLLMLDDLSKRPFGAVFH